MTKSLEGTILNAREVARHFKISDSMVYDLVKEGELPHIRLKGRILFRKESIEQYLKDLEKNSK